VYLFGNPRDRIEVVSYTLAEIKRGLFHAEEAICSREQIITKLREAEVLLSRGQNVGETCRQLDVSENTHYCWRKECGGLDIKQAKRLKELEKENARLKKLIADQALDMAILKEANRRNF
jgi:putative transposase